MAKKTIVTLVDDLTEEIADTTVAFGLDGVQYEIDLTDKHAEELRDLVAPYLAVARKASAGRTVVAAKPSSSGVDGAAVRAWATAQGIEVNNRGRIKAELIERYRAAGH